MKKIFFLLALFFFALTPVYGQALSDATGFVNRLDVQTGGRSFEVITTSNFDVLNFDFDKSKKKLTLHISSGLENNLGEVILPLNLLSGNLTFYLNGQEYTPRTRTNDIISFITLNFTGSGDNKLEIFGTTYLSGLLEKDNNVDKDIQTPVQKVETFDGSFGWWIILVGSLSAAAAFAVMKIRKRKSVQITDK